MRLPVNAESSPASNQEPQTDPDSEDQVPEATDANELASIPPPQEVWYKAKITARLQRSRSLVYQAAVQVIRNGQCNIVQVDQANAHIRFNMSPTTNHTSEHDMFIFEGVDGWCELDITSHEPNIEGRFDPIYHGIIKEIGKYLMFAAEAPIPSPLPLPPPQHEEPYVRPKYLRRRRKQGPQGLAIAGFICGLIGLLTSCIPIMGGALGVLGVVFGGIGLSQAKSGQSGFGVASLVLGILACLFSFVFLVAFLDRH